MISYRLIFLILLMLSNGVLAADEIRMPENALRPLKVGVAMFVNNITKVNEQASTIEATVNVQWRWKDKGLAFNPQETGMNRMEFNRDSAAKKLTEIWTPALTLANATIQHKEQGLFIYADGTVVLISRVKGIFDVKFRLDAFPFETQSLAVRILSERYNTNQIELTHNQFDINDSGLSQHVQLSGWQAQQLNFTTLSTQGWDGQYYPETQAHIVLARTPYAHLLLILMPFFLIMLIPTIGSFHIKMDLDKRLGLWSGSTLSLIALSFTYSTRYPALTPDSIITQLIVIGVFYQIVMIFLTITLLNPKYTEQWIPNKIITSTLIAYLHWAMPLGFLGLIISRVMLTALIV